MLHSYVDGASGPTVVFLHGFMGTGADWEPVSERFAEEFRCVFVDLPGHGGSVEALKDVEVGVEAMAEAVVETLEVLGDAADAFHLVGYSMGGRVALALALLYPDRVSRLVMESASPGIRQKKERQERAAQDDERARRIRQEGLVAFLEDWYALPLFESFREHSRYEEALARRREGDGERLAEVIRQMSPGRQPDLWPRLPEVGCPTLLGTGAEDPKYPAIVEQMGEAIPEAEVAIAEGCGHNVHFERPTWFVETVSDFLRTTADITQSPKRRR